MKRPWSTAWLLVALLATASGASCPRRQTPVAAPVAFAGPPGLVDLIQTINRNSEPIRQLQADDARLSIQGLPPLRSNLAMERPRNFRLRAQFVGMGEVLDMGSNQELFWALVDPPQMITNIPRAVFFARHDQFLQSHAREILPIKPDWLVEAFGLTYFDPSHVHEGPWQRGAGQLEFRSRIPTVEGEVGRITVVHETYGWILEQHAYDPQGRLAASAITSDHRYYPELGVSLPHRIEIRLPPPNRSFQLDVETYSINQLRGDPSQLFAMPAYAGFPQVDLAAPLSPPPAWGGSGGVPPGLPQPVAPVGPGYPVTGFRPRYRGYTANWQ